MESFFFHPKVVHLPIALAVLMPMIAGGLLLAWRQRWLPSQGWWLAVALQAVLVGSGIVALRTGESEEDRVEKVVSERRIEAHERAAERFVWVSGAVLGVMVLGAAFAKRRSGPALALAGAAGTLAVLGFGYETGQAGGSLVYQHGAAQAYAAPAQGTSAAPASAGREEDDD